MTEQQDDPIRPILVAIRDNDLVTLQKNIDEKGIDYITNPLNIIDNKFYNYLNISTIIYRIIDFENIDALQLFVSNGYDIQKHIKDILEYIIDNNEPKMLRYILSLKINLDNIYYIYNKYMHNISSTWTTTYSDFAHYSHPDFKLNIFELAVRRNKKECIHVFLELGYQITDKMKNNEYIREYIRDKKMDAIMQKLEMIEIHLKYQPGGIGQGKKFSNFIS